MVVAPCIDLQQWIQDLMRRLVSANWSAKSDRSLDDLIAFIAARAWPKVEGGLIDTKKDALWRAL